MKWVAHCGENASTVQNQIEPNSIRLWNSIIKCLCCIYIFAGAFLVHLLCLSVCLTVCLTLGLPIRLSACLVNKHLARLNEMFSISLWGRGNNWQLNNIKGFWLTKMFYIHITDWYTYLRYNTKYNTFQILQTLICFCLCTLEEFGSSAPICSLPFRCISSWKCWQRIT